jgi:hypothetical protein
MRQNRYKYLVSLAQELASQASRVRDLIGDRHWLSDGHHKEYLLRALLERHVPTGVTVSRGFVASAHDEEHCSSEQDLLVLDGTIAAPLFNQGGLAIAFPISILAAISVKTTLNSTTLESAIHGTHTVRQVAARDSVSPEMIWCGGFFLNRGTASLDALLNATKLAREALDRPNAGLRSLMFPCVGLDVVAAADDLLVVTDHETPDGDRWRAAVIRAYDSRGLGTAFFIAALLDHISSRRRIGPGSFRDFLSDPELRPLGHTECALAR